MYIALSVFAVFVILMIGEIGWRRHWLKGELGRKFVHILVGSFVAFWPFFMSWSAIRWLSLAFLVVVVVSDRLKIFKAVHSAQRPTLGEICFAVIVGALTFVTQNKGIYAASILQMSLADGFAAVIGTRYGKHNAYRVLGHRKSVAGTTAFIVTSVSIFVCFAAFSIRGLPSLSDVFIGVIGAAALENLGLYGIDNLIVPLYVGILLSTR
jgi:phytol kinase